MEQLIKMGRVLESTIACNIKERLRGYFQQPGRALDPPPVQPFCGGGAEARPHRPRDVLRASDAQALKLAQAWRSLHIARKPPHGIFQPIWSLSRLFGTAVESQAGQTQQIQAECR